MAHAVNYLVVIRHLTATLSPTLIQNQTISSQPQPTQNPSVQLPAG